MLTRSLSLVAAALAVTVIAAGPAQSQTDIPAPNVLPGACADQVLPHSTYTSAAAKKAKRSRTRMLTGSAGDVGCGLDRVQVSVARRVGKKCQYLTSALRLKRAKTSCGKATNWRTAKGTTRWSLQLLPKEAKSGKYVIRTRATDLAGNVEKVRSHRLTIR
jgi:hypothetical protein